MSAKILLAAVIVVAAVAAVAIIGPAAIGAGLQAVAAGTAGLGWTLATTVAASALLWAGSTILGALAPTPKVSANGAELGTQYNPQSGVPKVYGETVTGGVMTYYKSWGPKNVSLGMMSVLSSCGPVQSIETTYLGDSQFTGNFEHNPATGNAFLRSLTPAPAGKDGSALYKNYVTNLYVPEGGGDPFTVRAGFEGDTATDRNGRMPGQDAKFLLSGLAYTGTVFTYDTNAFPGGQPPKQLWKLKGVAVYDPRLDDTYVGGGVGPQRVHQYSTYGYSNNPAICALDYLLGRIINGIVVGGCGVPIESIDLAAFVAWANVCDANGWTCAGVTMSTDAKFDTFNAIAQSGSGKLADRGSLLSVVYDAPKTSMVTIGVEDVVGESTVTNSTSYSNRYNRIVPTYIEPNNKWAATAGELLTVAEWVTEDRGVLKTLEPTYGFVNVAAQAHQLAAYQLCDAREFLSATLICKPRLLGVGVGDCVTVNLPSTGGGLDLNNQLMVVTERVFDPMTCQVSLTLISETTSKHAYCLGQSQTPPASPALTAVYDPTNQDPPSVYTTDAQVGWAVTGGDIDQNGMQVPAVFVTGACDDPNAASVVCEYRKYGDTVWRAWSETPAKTTTLITLSGGDIVDKGVFEIAISYRSVLGILTPRLVLGPVTAGQYSVDWLSNVIVNVPDALKTDPDGYLNGQLIKFSGLSANAIVEAANSVSQTANTVAYLANTISGLHLDGLASQQELEELAETNIAAIIGQGNEIEARFRATYSNGVALTDIVAGAVANVATIGATVSQQQTISNTTVSTLSLIGVRSADQRSFSIDLNNVVVSPGLSLGQRLIGLDTAVGNAQATGALALSTIVTANAALTTQVTSLTATVVGNRSAADQGLAAGASATSAVANSVTALTATVNGNQTTALQQIGVVSTAQAANASLLTALTATVGTNAASFGQQVQVVSNQANASTTELNTLGAFNGANGTFQLNTSKVYVDGGQTLSSQQSLTESRFAGTTSSSILNLAQTGANTANATASTLNQMGVTLGQGSSWVLDSSKVYVGADGTTAAQKFSSLTSTLGNKADSSSIAASVNQGIQTSLQPGNALASAIQSVSTTANGATSTANFVLSSINGNQATAVLEVQGSTIVGLRQNSANGQFVIYAPQFSIVDNGNGVNPTVPFLTYQGNVYMTNVIAQNIAAQSIYAQQIVGGAVTNTVLSSVAPQNTYITANETTYLDTGYSSSGGMHVVLINVGTANFSTSQNTGVVVTLLRNGQAIEEQVFLAFENFGAGYTFVAYDQPGGGSWDYGVAVRYTSGSGTQCALQKIKFYLTELKK